MNHDQSFIQKAREKIFGALRKNAIERHHEKIEREEEATQIELFLDTCVADGLDPKNPRDLVIMLAAWELKKNSDEEEDRDPSDPDSHPLNF